MNRFSHVRDIIVEIISGTEGRAIYKIPLYFESVDRVISSRVEHNCLIVESSLKKNRYDTIENAVTNRKGNLRPGCRSGSSKDNVPGERFIEETTILLEK